RDFHVTGVQTCALPISGQYEELQELYSEYKDKLMIIGVPCNQFGGQEPGTAQEIQNFCEVNYGVTFLLTEKVNVKGKDKHELYKIGRASCRERVEISVV